MGMFDTIEVHRKLPLAVVEGVDVSDVKDLKKLIKWKEVEFQTKSLDDCLDHYKLSVNGKLYIKRQKYKEAKPKKHRSKILDGMPLLEPEGEPWLEPAPKVPTSLIFYSSVTLEPFSYWVEFEAIFLQGKLHEIKLLALEKTPSDFDAVENIFQKEWEWANQDSFVRKWWGLIKKFFNR